MEPVSHFFYSHRLKLQFWDYGGEGKPSLVLVHGGLDHARNWDWVARDLCRDYHVYALDLRGHGNSAWAPGAMYSIAEYVLDLSALLDVIGEYPIYLIGHSLGGVIVTHYAGIYPDRVRKLVNIEGLGFPAGHRVHDAYSERLRRWVEQTRATEKRDPRPYPDLASAVARMKEANPRLTDEQARHLTLHGTNWNSDGSLTWKFDNYARMFPPYGHDLEDIRELVGRIACPVLLFWGEESPMPDPMRDGRLGWIRNAKLVKVPRAGHWVHHDRLDVFLGETRRFLAEQMPAAT
jgi:pimeloyl-ACP methyl ester carboxylesterase